MDEQNETIEESELSVSDRRHGQSRVIPVAAACTTQSLCILGTVSTLFLLHLGADPLHIGIFSTITQLGAFVQIPGLLLVNRLGKVRLFFLARSLSLIPLGLLIALALFDGRGPAIVWRGIAILSLYVFIINTANTGWWSILQDVLVPGAVGEFFARMRTRLRCVEIIVPILVGAYLGKQPSGRQFVFPFVLGIAALAVACWFIRSVSERPVTVTRESMISRLRAVVKVVSVRRYNVYLLVRNLVANLFGPFWVVLLVARGVPTGYAVWLGASAALGSVLGLRQWAKIVDRHGSRSLLTVTLVAQALMGLGWLFLPEARTTLFVWSLVYFFIWGFLDGGYLIAQTHAMMEAVPVAQQNEGFVLTTYSGAVGGMIGGLLGGVVFQRMTEWSGAISSVDYRAWYLGLVQMGLLVVWFTATRLYHYPRHTPTREVVAQTVFKFINIIRP